MAYIAIVHITDQTVDDITDQAHTLEQIYGSRLVGIFDYPTRKDIGCTGCVRKGSEAWTRDRMGFMKCGICGKRNKRIRRFLTNALFDFLGANLYENAPAAFRTPEGYGLHADND